MDKKQLTEQEIRSNFIRPAVQDAGWSASQIREDYAITVGRIIARGGVCKRDKASVKRADFILFYKSHIPLAVIEAKDNKHSVSDGMQQALDYAERMNIPFVFTSNGDGFTFRNKQDASEIIIGLDEFPSPDTLWQMVKKHNIIDDSQEKVAIQPYYTENENKHPRYYQLNAINLTVDAVMKGQNRMLLVMATGTGKTYTAFQIIWRLWKAGIKKRILFLADRNALVDQTYANDFAPFKDKMTIVRNRKVDPSYEIYLALYQGLTGDDDKDVFKQFSPNFFDLIIIDECHRGSAKADSEWREILNYFSSASQIGLTATPKENKEVSNIDYFGEPIYTYSLKQGIEDGFLAPYRVIRVLLDKDAAGYRPYNGQVDKFGNEIPDRIYGTSDFDRELVLEQRTKIIAQTVSNYLKKHDNRMAKTIFFCVDTEHADRMRQALVNENKDLVMENERYVMRLTGDDEIGRKQVGNFSDVTSNYPVLVATSKLLTTGVDAQMVKFIVLDSSIKSMTEFKQIIGRGTRVREDLGKMFFTIFDFRNVTRLFADPDFDGPTEQDDEFTPGPNGEIPPELDEGQEVTSDNDKPSINDFPEWDEPPKGRRAKYYVHNVEVTVLKELVQYIDKDGKLMTESLTDYTRRNVLNQYATYDDFLNAWNSAERKQVILDELVEQGVLIDELHEQIGQEFDPFDLLCHIVFDQPPLTRRERANNVKKRNYFGKYGEQASAVLEALLEKYADTGVTNIESIDVLKINPFQQFGTPLHIVNRLFNGKANYDQAIRELKLVLYEAA
ncbi:MAG: DEAD/DEAH box helicase family protein [Defluviitaleaceae bacterium]|nr:DEAD/DEAH box helicase family protein [Defluviitaleaceae bacterium]